VEKTTVCVGCAFLFVLGCSDSSGPSENRTETITVTTLGDTCGQWQTDPAGTTNASRLISKCGEGLSCGYLEYAAVAANELPGTFGICMPASGYGCDTAFSSLCADPLLTCIVGFSSPNGSCFYGCEQHSDCVGPYQVCYSGGCQVITCVKEANGGNASCVYGSHCDMNLGVCVPD
jgi:hypothetical protein